MAVGDDEHVHKMDIIYVYFFDDCQPGDIV